ncbi:MAG: VWA domain-containing protein, partial [Chloroflexi bacterium]|nr:VWA domain-containing protein [Chloroflexota bacterium]
MRWIVVWALVWTLAGGALAAPRARAQAPAVDMSVNQVTDSTYPDVGVVLSVVDAAGVPVRGLTADQFSASDDDGPLAVASVQSAQDASLPLNVVVAIDISGSMVGEPLARAKDAANQFVRNLGPQDQAAIFTFNATVTPVTPFTNDRVRLTNAIASLNAGGGTALYEAVQTAAFAARSAPSTRRAIVLLTDGENADAPLSTATKDGSINAATGAGVPIFTVGFGAVADVTYLQFLAQATQAQFRAADTANVATVYG